MVSALPSKKSARARSREYDLRLYVAGATPKSALAYRNLELLCREFLAGRFRIEVVDLTKHPHLAKRDGILAVPTLVRHRPTPVHRIIGTLANTDRVLAGLDLPPQPPFPAVAGN